MLERYTRSIFSSEWAGCRSETLALPSWKPFEELTENATTGELFVVIDAVLRKT
jgi:hypothetical protein